MDIVLVGEVDERLVELGQLVDAVVADEGLSDEEHEVRRVQLDQPREGAHQRLVVLHSAGRVDQHDVDLAERCLLDRLERNLGRLRLVALVVDGNVQAATCAEEEGRCE